MDEYLYISYFYNISNYLQNNPFSQNYNSIRQIYMKILHNSSYLRKTTTYKLQMFFHKNDHHFMGGMDKRRKQWRTATVQGSDYTITLEFCSRTICQDH